MLNKHILISGRDTQAGLAVARVFKERGWKITGLVNNGECTCETTDAEPCVCVDLTDRAAVGKAISEIEAKTGPIGALFVSIPYLMTPPPLLCGHPHRLVAGAPANLAVQHRQPVLPRGQSHDRAPRRPHAAALARL